jgi:type IV pilus assembly protein PilN
MEIKLNLASKPYLNRQSVRLWLLAFCAVMAFLLVLNLSYTYQAYRQSNTLDDRFAELDKQIEGVKGVPAGYTPERYAAVKGEIALAKEIVAADQFHWTEMLSRFEAVVPRDVSIRSIQPNFKERSVIVSGIARDVSAMTKFLDNLLASETFNQAFLQRHGDVELAQQGDKMKSTGFSLEIREAF